MFGGKMEEPFIQPVDTSQPAESLQPSSPETTEAKKRTVDAELEALLSKQKATIKVVGTGGGGNNTINRITAMIRYAKTLAYAAPIIPISGMRI